MPMNFKLDMQAIQKETEKKAGEAYLRAAEKAKRSLGAEGQAIVIRRLLSPRRQGSTVNYAEISYPSEELRVRFEQALQRELR